MEEMNILFNEIITDNFVEIVSNFRNPRRVAWNISDLHLPEEKRLGKNIIGPFEKVTNVFLFIYTNSDRNFKLLLGKSTGSVSKEKQCWGLFGGKVDLIDGNDSLNTAFRELGEEYYGMEYTNDFVESSKKRLGREYFWYYFRENKMLIYFIDYLYSPLPGIIPTDATKNFKPSSAMSSVRWVSFKSLQDSIQHMKGTKITVLNNMCLRSSFAMMLKTFLKYNLHKFLFSKTNEF